jgi:hypothetical protein
MTEDERGSWLIGGVQMDIRLTVRSVHLEHGHAGDAGRLDPFVSEQARLPGMRLTVPAS